MMIRPNKSEGLSPVSPAAARCTVTMWTDILRPKRYDVVVYHDVSSKISMVYYHILMSS